MNEDTSIEQKPKHGRPPTAQLRTLKAFMSDVRSAAEFAEGLRAELAELPGGPDTDFIFRTAQAVFEADVARRGDLKQHIALRRLRQIDRTQDENHLQRERAIEQRERALALSRERFEFDAAEVVLDHLSELKAILQDRSMKRPAKIQAVRMRLFGAGPRPPEEGGPPKAGSFKNQEPSFKEEARFKIQGEEGTESFGEEATRQDEEAAGDLREGGFTQPF